MSTDPSLPSTGVQSLFTSQSGTTVLTHGATEPFTFEGPRRRRHPPPSLRSFWNQNWGTSKRTIDTLQPDGAKRLMFTTHHLPRVHTMLETPDEKKRSIAIHNLTERILCKCLNVVDYRRLMTDWGSPFKDLSHGSNNKNTFWNCFISGTVVSSDMSPRDSTLDGARTVRAHTLSHFSQRHSTGTQWVRSEPQTKSFVSSYIN